MSSTAWLSLSSQPPIGAADWGGTAANVGKSDKPPPPAKPMARIRLADLGDVAKEYRKLYREARAGTISTAEASKLGYLLNMLAGILTASQIEERVAALESERPSR